MECTAFTKTCYMRTALFCMVFLFVFESCTSNTSTTENTKPAAKEESKPINGNIYTAEKIGWSIKLPGDEWKIVSDKERNKSNAQGEKLLEKSTGVDVDMSGVQNLISFKKDHFNSFVSIIEPYDKDTHGDYDQLLTMQHTVLKQAYANANIPATYEMGATRIGGVMLDWFSINAKLPTNKSKEPVIMYLFSCELNKHFFSMAITYNNDKDKETLENVVYSSKFALKK